MKTMAIRLEDDLHEQLSILSQLTATSLTEIIRTAIETHVAAKCSDPEIAAQADQVLAEIDAAANRRRDAIGALFQGKPPKATGTARRGRKAGDES